MKLEKILKSIEISEINGTLNREITEVVYDSRKVVEGCLFICIKGANYDSHEYVAEAIKLGAKGIVCSEDFSLDSEVLTDGCTVIIVKNTRYALACISAAWFGHPATKLKTIGITGTKGKTTTTYLVKSILEAAGYKTGLIGTIETIIGEKATPAVNTTPESYVLQETFATMVEEGCQVVVMEVSSQGLMLHRTAGFMFDIGIFTNLEPDHIGPNEHSSFEQYLQCKGLLFKQCKVGIVNGDDSHYEKVVEGHTCLLERYGLKEYNEIKAKELELINASGQLGVSFVVEGFVDLKVKIPTPGKFSVYNGLTAIAICRHFKVPGDKIQQALQMAHVKGRIELIKVSDAYTLMIDYAHNAMSLKSLLTTLKEYKPNRIICVFGCGGNRSVQRRYEMGEISGEYADITIITSDNPRFEEPVAIIEDIKVGMKKTKGEYLVVIDRKEAIKKAMDIAQTGDIIVLAGKGHETYQEIKGVKYPMDERVLIKEILEEK